MYRINHKAVWLTVILHQVIGFFWYTAAPDSFGVPHIPTIDGQTMSVAGYFVVASIVYVYYLSWLTNRLKTQSRVDMVWVILSSWLMLVLPVFLVTQQLLQLPMDALIYLLSYGLVCAVVAAAVLPLWRQSRSIFKG